MQEAVSPRPQACLLPDPPPPPPPLPVPSRAPATKKTSLFSIDSILTRDVVPPDSTKLDVDKDKKPLCGHPLCRCRQVEGPCAEEGHAGRQTEETPDQGGCHHVSVLNRDERITGSNSSSDVNSHQEADSVGAQEGRLNPAQHCRPPADPFLPSLPRFPRPFLPPAAQHGLDLSLSQLQAAHPFFYSIHPALHAGELKMNRHLQSLGMSLPSLSRRRLGQQALLMSQRHLFGQAADAEEEEEQAEGGHPHRFHAEDECVDLSCRSGGNDLPRGVPQSQKADDEGRDGSASTGGSTGALSAAEEDDNDDSDDMIMMSDDGHTLDIVGTVDDEKTGLLSLLSLIHI